MAYASRKSNIRVAPQNAMGSWNKVLNIRPSPFVNDRSHSYLLQKPILEDEPHQHQTVSWPLLSFLAVSVAMRRLSQPS